MNNLELKHLMDCYRKVVSEIAIIFSVSLTLSKISFKKVKFKFFQATDVGM